MGFTSDAYWFLLIKTLLIKNNKKRGATLKNEAGGDEKHVSIFLLGLRLLHLLYDIARVYTRKPKHAFLCFILW